LQVVRRTIKQIILDTSNLLKVLTVEALGLDPEVIIETLKNAGYKADFGLFNSHHRLASPVSHWERLKIGGGTPPILTRHGWLIVYHGVNELEEPGSGELHLQYSAGVMILSKEHRREILYRSAKPVLKPGLLNERNGIVPNVVFPNGIDRRDDLGLPDRFDVYYGMADNWIGVARLNLPDVLPPEGVADPPEGKV
jgi:beta-1,2-mannobiose phosphorylase / 1,2-beta-oligomannan phosphorylase